MGKYRPGTIDSYAVNERRRKRERRTLRSANQPTGSQVFGTTAKVKEIDQSIQQIVDDAQKAIESANKVLGMLDVGTVIQRSEMVDADDLGLPGTWEFLTASHIPMTGKTVYLYERVE